MRKLSLYVSTFMTASFFTVSCGSQAPSDRNRNDDLEIDTNSTECYKTERSGCIQGHVVAAPEISVAGKQYFDAEAFSSEFPKTLNVKDAAGKQLDLTTLSFRWLTNLTNNDFVNEFKVYLKGRSAKTNVVLRNGSFTVSHLPEGQYELRAQRVLKFALDAKQPEDVEQKTKTYCLTIYSADTIEVRKNHRTTGIVFDQFNYDVKECASEESKTEVSF